MEILMPWTRRRGEFFFIRFPRACVPLPVILLLPQASLSPKLQVTIPGSPGLLWLPEPTLDQGPGDTGQDESKHMSKSLPPGKPQHLDRAAMSLDVEKSVLIFHDPKYPDCLRGMWVQL